MKTYVIRVFDSKTRKKLYRKETQSLSVLIDILSELNKGDEVEISVK